MRRINDELPADINILRIQKVRHTFHARHSARAEATSIRSPGGGRRSPSRSSGG